MLSTHSFPVAAAVVMLTYSAVTFLPQPPFVVLQRCRLIHRHRQPRRAAAAASTTVAAAAAVGVSCVCVFLN